jgi:uncharacterized membrane protein YfcA/uncharacterized membrane protein YedE/YeeE
MIIAVSLSMLIGLSLGLLGGGGSILTIPILIYALGVEPKHAIAMSLFVVGATSAVGALQHALSGRVRVRTAAAFGAAGIAGAFAGGRINRFIPADILLVAFAVLMVVMALAMLRGRKELDVAVESGPVARVALEGAAVGFMTGLVGAGGGFIVVPALVLLVGLPMREAVATSLLVIALNSFAGFAGSIGHVSLDWTLTAVVTGAAVAGAIAGTALSARVPQATLRRMFAWLVLAMAVYMLWRQLPPSALAAVHDFLRAHPPWVHASAGGVLIGLAAAGLLLLHGKVAGISGILGGALSGVRGDLLWRSAFIAGLLAGGALFAWRAPALLAPSLPRSPVLIALAGVLVGYGTRLGNGCTSGHGICGVGRVAPRSMVATATFIAAGAVSTFAITHLLGAAS